MKKTTENKLAEFKLPLDIQLFAEEEKEEEQEEKEESKEEKTSEKGSKSEKEESKKEAKYTDDDVNNISKKNSDKAVKKLMKDLGIDDIEKAKQILSTARAEEEKKKTPEDKKNDLTTELSKKDMLIQEKNKELAQTKLELKLSSAGIKDFKKLERAKKMIPYENVIDEDGELSEELMKQEIKSLLEDFPEFKSEKKDEKKGFQFGSDGKEDKGKVDKKKQVVSQKRWNRFN